MRVSFWTDERVTLLRQYVAEGLTGGQIAGMFGNEVTRHAVIGKCFRMKLPLQSEEAERRRNPSFFRPATHKTPRVRKLRLRPRAPIEAQPVMELAAVELPPSEIETAGIPFFDIGHGQCRYPLTDTTPIHEFLFCGLPTEHDDCSYCPGHRAICEVKARRDYASYPSFTGRVAA